ncbi:MAG: hypothetical protein J6A21_02295, partial [Lentisphaeria bacterium]|nr:hypothetical protein [Lentisphaeria bacterium]
MNRIFQETFDSSLNSLPGAWYVERNSDLKEVPAIRRGEKCIEFLSAGNKFLPVIPQVKDFRMESSLSFSLKAARLMGILISFGYDTVTGRGQTVRIRRPEGKKVLVFEYGSTRANLFFPLEEKVLPVKDEAFDGDFEVILERKGTCLTVSAAGKTCAFAVKKTPGMIAVAREHFYDVLKLTKMEIFADCGKGKPAGRFTIPFPLEHTFYPIYCDVVLTDHGNCMEASLKLHGSAQETEAGEGNYHGMRTDRLVRPYLKVLTREKIEKYVIFDRTMLLCVQSLVKPYFYERLCERPQWPFIRNVRFMKPEGAFDLAVGAELYVPATLRDLAQSPSETVFDLSGKILYSGKGMTDEDTFLCEFLSQKKKEMMKRIPKTDPRYEEAILFLENNHFFLEKEAAFFRILLTGKAPLPCAYEVILEDACFRPLKKLESKAAFSETALGVSVLNRAEITFDPIRNLSCGVYHLRIRSLDPSLPPWEEYCAFEVMSTKKDALCPPLASKLPYIYNGRTETRGLLTDGVEVWKGKSSDLPHYHSCANFLPKAARDFDVAPTVHAYQREYFLWLGSRCADKPALEDNWDLVAKADYLNICWYFNQVSSLWRMAYGGRRLIRFYELAKSLNDPEFDLEDLEKAVRKIRREKNSRKDVCSSSSFKEIVSHHNYVVMAKKYWEKWLDVLNEDIAEQNAETLKELRKYSPRIRYSQYGPAHIYVGHLKGHDYSRILSVDKIDPESLGFWQYEDYPFACRYGLERGSYYLTGHLMAHPEARIYPEIYTGGGVQGCPDGAVFYAHPPQGVRKGEYTARMVRQVFEYIYATAYFGGDKKFHYWEKRGFQACSFTRAWYKSLLTAWGLVLDHEPARPWRSPAFVSSDSSRRAHEKKIITDVGLDLIVDVRNTAAEDVPFLYDETRKNILCNGFQVMEENLPLLTEKETALLVLPPLKGMSEKTLAHIRKLHKAGVNLIACESAEGLEDLFGVKDTGKMRTVTKVRGVNGFLEGAFEMCDDENCEGSYVADGAKVLLDAEIPVLTLKKNGKSFAAFFNVPPQLVKADRL